MSLFGQKRFQVWDAENAEKEIGYVRARDPHHALDIQARRRGFPNFTQMCYSRPEVASWAAIEMG